MAKRTQITVTGKRRYTFKALEEVAKVAGFELLKICDLPSYLSWADHSSRSYVLRPMHTDASNDLVCRTLSDAAKTINRSAKLTEVHCKACHNNSVVAVFLYPETSQDDKTPEAIVLGFGCNCSYKFNGRSISRKIGTYDVFFYAESTTICDASKMINIPRALPEDVSLEKLESLLAIS